MMSCETSASSCMPWEDHWIPSCRRITAEINSGLADGLLTKSILMRWPTILHSKVRNKRVRNEILHKDVSMPIGPGRCKEHCEHMSMIIDVEIFPSTAELFYVLKASTMYEYYEITLGYCLGCFLYRNCWQFLDDFEHNCPLQYPFKTWACMLLDTAIVSFIELIVCWASRELDSSTLIVS